MIQVDPKNV